MMSNSLWKLLLELKEVLYSSKEDIDNILIQDNQFILNSKGADLQDDILIQFQESNSSLTCKGTLLQCKENGRIEISQKGKLDSSAINCLLLYLPFCLASLLTRKRGKALSITHFAQTMDGYIATESNHSKWIGNDENLIHAHRLRALVDGVIIGNNTLLEDQPQLTVRHVKGKNPLRIVIGNTLHSEDSLVSCSSSPILRITNQHFKPNSNNAVDSIQIESKTKSINTSDILEALHQRGIHSVLIEGGSYTSSLFLKEKSIDMLQLHLAPMLFGSGIKTFNLPTIQEVDDCCSFKHHFYHPIGDAIMFTGFIHD